MTRPIRIVFVWTAAEFSTQDVARGYRRALDLAGGFEIYDYRLPNRLRYHARALGDEKSQDISLLSRLASEGIVLEAMRHHADLVLIISGLTLHPDALTYLRQAGIRTACVFTESPYDDKDQREFHAIYPDMQCFTMERTSAVDGWHYLPHAYDPEIHYPRPSLMALDVLFIGTLWPERIRTWEAVDWSGIRAQFHGTWVAPPLPAMSPLGALYEDGCIHNEEAAKMFSTSAINLNWFRSHPTAESLGPRAYELAACGAFQLTDYRTELDEVFGHNVVATTTAATLRSDINYWLAHEPERRHSAHLACEAVRAHTFSTRLQTLLDYLT